MSIIQSFFFASGSAPTLPTYSVTPSTTSVNEGGSVIFTVNTTGVSNGTTLYFNTETVSGVVLGAGVENDFTDGYIFGEGSFTINNGTGSFTRSLRNDARTEGSESFKINIRTDSSSGPIVATSSTVTINDTSVLTYTITPSTTSVNEGDTVTFTVTSSSNVSPTASLYWTTNVVSGTVNASDFSDGRLTNAPGIPHGHLGTSSSFTRTLSNDLTTEGSESFQIQLRSDSTSGPILATSSTVTINDTSVSSPLSVEVLMMAGGGGAISAFANIAPSTADDVGLSMYGGGGGGAGGLYIHSATLNPGSSSTVTIGGGGSGNANGSATLFTGASNAVGGGTGGSSTTGSPGGSGGGGRSGGSGGSGTSGQGNAGGNSANIGAFFGAGGGGGKGGAGSVGPAGNGGAGGSGYNLATFRGGTSLTVAFGGGGSGSDTTGLNGDGGVTASPAANTGGGARNSPVSGTTATGGSGRVIVRYAGSTQRATGGTVTTATVSGSPYTIHDFTGNGTFSVT